MKKLLLIVMLTSCSKRESDIDHLVSKYEEAIIVATEHGFWSGREFELHRELGHDTAPYDLNVVTNRVYHYFHHD